MKYVKGMERDLSYHSFIKVKLVGILIKITEEVNWAGRVRSEEMREQYKEYNLRLLREDSRMG